MHYTKVKPLIEQCGVVWEEGKNIQVGKKELCMFADLLVEAKTLTDEEIVSLINKHIDYVPDGDGMKVVGVMDLCRAILRKAQNG
jgi:hypothetical protein